MPVLFPQGLRRTLVTGGAIISASALLLTGCAPAPDEDADIAQDRSDYTGCIVSDSGGFDDRSFNQNSYEGLLKAKDDYGIETKQAESQAITDYEPNVSSMVRGGCGLTVTVGFNLSDVTKSTAEAHPDKHFATVDDNSIDLPNVRPIIYDTSQAAFLAGYLAAGSTKTGKVATFGGQEIPTVTIFMDGFAEGVNYYNQQKGKDVSLLGWDVDKQTGSFTGDFEDTGKGKTTTQNFLNEGADIVMPVAGPVGNGAMDAVNGFNSDEPKNPARIIWVDSDGYETLAGGQEYVLTSVIKKMGDAVEDAYVADMDGKFTNEPYIGDLTNDGVGLAPFHDQSGNVSDDMKDELKDLKTRISNGEVPVESKASPVKKQ